MIAPLEMAQAIRGYYTDREILQSECPDKISYVDETLDETQKNRIKEYSEASKEEKDEAFNDIVEEYKKNHIFFPGDVKKDKADLLQMLMYDTLVFTDLYLYELEFGDSSKEEVDKFVASNVLLQKKTSEDFGGIEGILSLCKSTEKEDK